MMIKYLMKYLVKYQKLFPIEGQTGELICCKASVDCEHDNTKDENVYPEFILKKYISL